MYVTDCENTVNVTPGGMAMFVIDPSVLATKGHDIDSDMDGASVHDEMKVEEPRVKVDVTLLRSGMPCTVHSVDGIDKERAEVVVNLTCNVSGTDVESHLPVMLKESCSVT